MIDLEFIERLIRSLDESGLDSIELERGGTRLRLSKSAPASSPIVTTSPVGQAALASSEAAGEEARPAAAEEVPPSNLVEVTSPMVGTFYRAPAPDAPPYAEVGKRVDVGDTLCIIEAMKLMNELEAEVSGTIAEVCVDNAEPVEYGQVLFRVDPS